jgi:hypothetical protein
MTSLLLLPVAGIWLIVAALISILVFRMLPKQLWRIPFASILFLALIPLPVIDEIVGKKQFERLCNENSTIQVDRAKAAGETVYLADLPDVEIKGTWVRVVLKPWRYVDSTTKEPVVSYNTLRAAGGWFVHALPVTGEGRVPLIFKGSCVPANRPASAQTFREFGINYIERPAKEKGK